MPCWLLLSGLASDYVLEGPNRNAQPHITSNVKADPCIIEELGRGLTFWKALAAIEGRGRSSSALSIAPGQQLKQIVHRIDPTAFVVIDTAQQAIGEGFKRLSG